MRRSFVLKMLQFFVALLILGVTIYVAAEHGWVMAIYLQLFYLVSFLSGCLYTNIEREYFTPNADSMIGEIREDVNELKHAIYNNIKTIKRPRA